MGQLFTPGGAAAASYSTLVKKTANQVINNSDVLTADSELKIPCAANKTYAFKGFIYCASSPTPDLKFSFSIPAAASIIGVHDALIGASGTATNVVGSVDLTIPVILTTSSSSVTVEIGIKGLITIGATAGDVVFQWAQNTATVSDSVVYKGSHLEIIEI